MLHRVFEEYEPKFQFQSPTRLVRHRRCVTRAVSNSFAVAVAGQPSMIRERFPWKTDPRKCELTRKNKYRHEDICDALMPANYIDPAKQKDN